MRLRFYSDTETGEPLEGSRVAVGRTLSGRLLRVIYVPDLQPDSHFVMTTYELQGKTAMPYPRRRRRKR